MSVIIDVSFAKKNSIEHSIVYTTLFKQCELVKSQGITKFYKDDMWWFYCGESTLELLFPFLTKDRLSKILSSLEKKKLILFSENRKALTTKTTGEVKNKIVVQTVKSVSISITREVDGELITRDELLGNVVNELIDKFRYIDPSYDKYFKIKAQRRAIEEMVIEYGGNITMLTKLLDTIPMTNQQQYAPVITSPIDFRNKAAKLISFLQRKKTGNSNMVW